MSVGAAAAVCFSVPVFPLWRNASVSFSGQKGQHMEDCVKFSLCARAAEYQLQREITLFSLAHSFFRAKGRAREKMTLFFLRAQATSESAFEPVSLSRSHSPFKRALCDFAALVTLDVVRVD
jgi:hypothetical protein